MSIWDTPGGAHFAQANGQDYKNADAVILMYAIDLESTFDAMQEL